VVRLDGELQRPVDVLADGDRGHYDDELRPAIALVQLEDGLGVAVGLAGASFHLDILVDRRRSEGLLPVSSGAGTRAPLASKVLKSESDDDTGRFCRRWTYWMFSRICASLRARSAYLKPSSKALTYAARPGSIR
jgi:hypothetical protein